MADAKKEGQEMINHIEDLEKKFATFVLIK